jgi:hypothetical protein
MRFKDGRLPFEAEDAAMHIGDIRHDTSVVHQVARGEVVAAIDHHIVIVDDVEDIAGMQQLLIGNHGHIGVESL